MRRREQITFWHTSVVPDGEQELRFLRVGAPQTSKTRRCVSAIENFVAKDDCCSTQCLSSDTPSILPRCQSCTEVSVGSSRLCNRSWAPELPARLVENCESSSFGPDCYSREPMKSLWHSDDFRIAIFSQSELVNSQRSRTEIDSETFAPDGNCSVL